MKVFTITNNSIFTYGKVEKSHKYNNACFNVGDLKKTYILVKGAIIGSKVDRCEIVQRKKHRYMAVVNDHVELDKALVIAKPEVSKFGSVSFGGLYGRPFPCKILVRGIQEHNGAKCNQLIFIVEKYQSFVMKYNVGSGIREDKYVFNGKNLEKVYGKDSK